MFKQDYIMNQIRNLAKLLVKMVLNKESVTVEIRDETGTTGQETLLQTLYSMTDRGDINAAENLLYEELDFEDLEQYEIALAFYLHVNEMDDTFLEEHDYSRMEIKEGICDISKEFGIAYDVSSMIPDPQ